MKTQIAVALLLVPVLAGAQVPRWDVQVLPPVNPVPVGMCFSAQLSVTLAGTRDRARDRAGYLIDMSQFDMSVTGGNAASHQADAQHLDVCGCQGGAPGGVATITARYPARSLPEAKRWPGLVIERSATFTLAAPKGASEPSVCAAARAAQAAPAANNPVGAPSSSTAGNGGAANAANAAAGGGPSAAAGAGASGSASNNAGTAGAATTGAATNGGAAVGAAASGATSGAGAPSGQPGGAAVGAAASGAVGGATNAAAGGGPSAAAGAGASGSASNNAGTAGAATTGAATNGGAAVGAAASGVTSGAGAPSGQPNGQPSGAAGGAATAAGGPLSPGGASLPVNPVGITALQIGTGQVLLSWDPVRDAQFYAVFGPGLAPGGQRVEQVTAALAAGQSTKVMVGAFNVPAGRQEWAVASFYANNLSTPAAAFPRVALDVSGAGPTANTTPAAPATPPAASTPPPSTSPPPSASTPASSLGTNAGKYLVTITGIRAYQASQDDMLSRDGVGDEIYAAAFVRAYDRRTSELLNTDTRVSATHGDVTHFSAQRLQAGTRSLTGGIQDGDMIPQGPLLAARSVAPQVLTFPMRIWEGVLIDGVDALVISPSLWEQDAGRAFFDQWIQNQTMLNASLFAKQGLQEQINARLFGSLTFGMSSNDANTGGQSVGRYIADSLVAFGGWGMPVFNLLSSTSDRPLGLVGHERDQTSLPNQVVVLTREIIEAALAAPARGHIPSPVANAPQSGLLAVSQIPRIGMIANKPGIIVLQFEDRSVVGAFAFPERPAIYQMFLQVERVP
jgi:hypothetical protein